MQEAWGDTKFMSIHCWGFHIPFFVHCHCQQPYANIQWQLALSLIFKPSLMRNLMSSSVLLCGINGIQSLLFYPLSGVYMLLRKMAVFKLKKWLSPIVTHRGQNTWMSVHSPLTLSRRWAQVPHQPHTILWKVGAKITWTWVSNCPSSGCNHPL